VPVWLAWTRGLVLLHGHPASLVVTSACAFAGVVALAWAVATLLLGGRDDRGPDGPSSHRGRPTRQELQRRARWRVALAVPALVLSVLTVSVLGWSRPLPAAPVAVAAMQSGPDVRVADRVTWYELQPQRKNASGRVVKPTVGLVFYPGARVDARAYAPLLRPLAAAGFLVVVLKEPFGIGLVNADQAETALEVHPEIRYWAAGGHSLGGVAASSFADTHRAQVRGLLLYAAYPARKLTRTDLQVLSVSGDADGLATPADIERSKALLPVGTRYLVVPGAVHAYFGDYGAQRGDGTATTPREAAQAQVVAGSKALMGSLAPRPKVQAKAR
jgi:hypothetical protein